MPEYYYHAAHPGSEPGTVRHWRSNRVLRVGDVLSIFDAPILPKGGLFATYRLLDALDYAPKRVLCRVTMEGARPAKGHNEIAVEGTDRTIAAMLDMESTQRLLLDLAAWLAKELTQLWDAPDKVRQHLATAKAREVAPRDLMRECWNCHAGQEDPIAAGLAGATLRALDGNPHQAYDVLRIMRLDHSDTHPHAQMGPTYEEIDAKAVELFDAALAAQVSKEAVSQAA